MASDLLIAGAPFGRRVTIPAGSALRRFTAFLGPGYLVAVGYMDPGNWATDLAAGSAYGYRLLTIVALSSAMAMVLQYLSLRLGIATGRDLARLCRDTYSRPLTWALWVLAEIGIVACDLAEVLGAAIALELLFGLPLLWGVGLGAFDTILVLGLQRFGFRAIEAVIIGLITLIGAGFVYEMALAQPELGPMLRGLLPTGTILTDHDQLWLAVGIIGATVMPHNLYLHSAIVGTRGIGVSTSNRREAVRFAGIDSTLALILAFAINAAILILAAAVFNRAGHSEVATLQDAHALLTPLLGASTGALVFALALLAAGQNATVTGTLAGQIVMEGFLELRLPPWLRRLVTRSLALVPAILVIAISGEAASNHLLIASQVVLSLQLPFAMIPLIMFTGNRGLMGDFANPLWLKIVAWTIAAALIAINLVLILQSASLI